MSHPPETPNLPASTHRLSRPDGTLAYDVIGEGPPVVMLPGLGDLRASYRFLAPPIAAAGFTSVPVDLRGHGGSSVGWPDHGVAAAADDVAALVETLGRGPAVVVGTSFGAAPAVWAAAERPDLVRGIVLVGPFVRPQPTPAWKVAMLRLLLSGPWKVGAWGAFYGTLFPTRKPDDHAEHLRALLANLREPGRFDALRAMAFRDDRAVEARLGRVAAPALVVMGSRDPDFADPEAEARAVADAVGGSVHLVDGAGHYPHVEMPEHTVDAIVRFVERVHGAGAATAGLGHASGAARASGDLPAAEPDVAVPEGRPVVGG